MAGEIEVEVNCGEVLEQAAPRGFRFAATTNHSIRLNLGLRGRINAVLRGLEVRDNGDLGSRPFTSVSNRLASFRGLTNLVSGRLTYNADGLLCVAVQLAGLDCEDDMDLSEQPPAVIDEVPCEITVESGRLRVTGSLDFRQYIDPEQPQLGLVSGRANFTATGVLRPALEIRPDSGALEVEWCRRFVRATLERSTSMDSETWTPVESVVEETGEVRRISVPVPDGPTFFRLRVEE